jgi:hypothetical protein
MSDVCSHCGAEAMLETFEQWNSTHGWRRVEWLKCTKLPKVGASRDSAAICGKITPLKEVPIQRDALSETARPRPDDVRQSPVITARRRVARQPTRQPKPPAMVGVRLPLSARLVVSSDVRRFLSLPKPVQHAIQTLISLSSASSVN